MSVEIEHKINSSENINTWLDQINDQSKAAVSIDCVIFGYLNQKLHVLLIECNMPPYKGMHSLVGDLVHQTEHLKEGANRILFERTGLKDVYMEQVQAFGYPDRHPLARVISIAYFTLISLNDHNIVDFEGRKPNWVPIENIGEMAFDHKKIFETSLRTLQQRIRQYPILFGALADEFTLIQLQEMFESIIGIELDKRNFRRKIQSIPYLSFTGQFQKAVNHRPAKIYRFDFEAYMKDVELGRAIFHI